MLAEDFPPLSLRDFEPPENAHFNNIAYPYPAPNPATIKRIAHFLWAQPVFYTETLHLMRRMGLPAPWDSLPQENKRYFNVEETSSDVFSTVSPSVDSSNSTKEPAAKKSRLDYSATPTIETEEQVSSSEISPPIEQSQCVETIRHSIPEADCSKTTKTSVLTIDQVKALPRLPPEHFSTDVAFRNFAPGLPSCKLYVKNLAKSIGEEDLKEIFAPFSTIDAVSFTVEKMRGGRMRGQAFVTYSSFFEAQTALQTCNGLILNGKPIVVMFAKTGSAN